MRFLILLLFAPSVAAAQMAAWARDRALADFTYLELRDLTASPISGDTLELRIWWDGSLSSRSILQVQRANGVWMARRVWLKPSRVEILPDSIDWAARWDAALRAQIAAIPQFPHYRSSVPRDDGEFFVVQWSHNGVSADIAADNPALCQAPSDSQFLTVISALTGQPQQCRSR